MRLRPFLFIVFAALFLSACNLTLAADITPPPNYVPPSPLPTLGPLYPAAPPDIQTGANIYASKCLPCHGETGLGDGAQGKQLPVTVAALGLPEVARAASPARWFTVVSQGNIERYMPPFTSLSEKDRWDVVGYALSLHTTPEMLQQGQELFEANCAACDTAFFTDQQQMAALSLEDLAQLVRNGGQGLTAFPAELSEDQLFAVAAYLRSLSFAEPAPPTPTLAVTLETATLQAAGNTPLPASPSAQGTAATDLTLVPGDTPAAVITPGQGTPAPTIEVPPPAEGGIVSGSVTNQSGAPIPAGLTITLRGYDHVQDAGGPQETLTRPGTLASDGSYLFGNVELPEGRLLLVELEYQGITYQSGFKAVQPGEARLTLDPLNIYESSTDFSGLVVDQLHVAFDFGTGQSVQVFEIFSFSNQTEKAVVIKTDGSQVPFIEVPEGALDVGIEAGQDSAPYAPAKDGIAILPSDTPYSLIAFFSLPYDPKGLSVEQPLVLKTESISVFVPKGIKLKSEDLSDAGSQDISGSTFQMYSSKQLPSGSELAFTLSGKPVLTGDGSGQINTRQGLIFGAGALGLVLIGLGVWLYLRDRNAGLDADQELENEYEDSQSVLDAIIALDDLYRAGKIPDEAYRTRRAELKEQLRDLESRDAD